MFCYIDDSLHDADLHLHLHLDTDDLTDSAHSQMRACLHMYMRILDNLRCSIPLQSPNIPAPQSTIRITTDTSSPSRWQH